MKNADFLARRDEFASRAGEKKARPLFIEKSIYRPQEIVVAAGGDGQVVIFAIAPGI
ncbi:MAG TPA: hypothetical protein PLG50_01820 [bacterium]|nr:hypothetical protein [bacterium]